MSMTRTTAAGRIAGRRQRAKRKALHLRTSRRPVSIRGMSECACSVGHDMCQFALTELAALLFPSRADTALPLRVPHTYVLLLTRDFLLTYKAFLSLPRDYIIVYMHRHRLSSRDQAVATSSLLFEKSLYIITAALAVVEVTVRDETPKRSTLTAAESKQHEQRRQWREVWVARTSTAVQIFGSISSALVRSNSLDTVLGASSPLNASAIPKVTSTNSKSDLVCLFVFISGTMRFSGHGLGASSPLITTPQYLYELVSCFSVRFG
jgi:hypothetical protein